jgi:hypothetical protein
MQRMPLLTVIGLCCAMGLISCVTKTATYERHVERAYDVTGKVRPGYATINLEYLDALSADLEACYARKNP